MRRSVLLLGLSLAAAAWWYAARFAPRWLQVVRLRVSVPGLSRAWEGARIAHLSDFHAGGGGETAGMLWTARRLVIEYQPDLIAITGDFYDEGQPVESGGLFADWPPDVPVLAVLGNHDFRGGEENLRRVIEELRAGGVKLLRNEAMLTPLRGHDAWVVGVDDPHTWQSDEARAFDGLPDGVDALLYLTHSPAGVSLMPIGRARIALAGHTHGGQLRLTPSGEIPFVGALRRLLREPPKNDPPVHRGYHWLRGSLLIISNGLGVSRLPLRLFTRPQVVLIELTCASASGPACDNPLRYVMELEPPSRPWRWLS